MSPSVVAPFANLFNRLVAPSDTQPFNLSQLEEFPFSDWTSMQEFYQVYVNWYEGKPLNEQLIDAKTGAAVDRFPIKLNPIPGTCEKHAAVLLGNTLESIREGGLPVQFIPTIPTSGKSNKPAPKVKPDEAPKPMFSADEKKPSSLEARKAAKVDPQAEAEKQANAETAETISKAINKAFEYAGGGAMFVDAGITSQFMGGCVWKVHFDAENEEYPVQVEYVDPKEFFGIPKGNNHWELHDAWFVREISMQDAVARGYVWNQMDDRFYYVEHWTVDHVKVYINETVVQDEENVFGIVPFVYIPHIRVRSFIGKSLITEAVKGIIKEWNLRFGDVGDAVAEDSHAVLATVGVRGNLQETHLSDGRRVIHLGSKSGLGTNETDPNMFAVNTKSTSEPMIKFNQMLEGQYRKETKHPAVADGEDEGSQRSAATLTVRMWPLISHVELERINWTTGLTKLAFIILTFYSKKGLEGITEDMVKLPITIKWSTALPRDREALINELAIRKKNGMTSLHHILELLGDVVDIERELELLDEEADQAQMREMEKLEVEAKLNPKPDFGGGNKPKGNATGKNNAEKGDRSDSDGTSTLKKES
jgi:hypothetical protein